MRPDYYVVRQRYADQLAACVLLDPNLSPSHDELPRPMIHDEELRHLLLLASLSLGKSERLVELAYRRLSASYVRRVVLLGCQHFQRESAFVWLAGWYAARLRELLDLERQYVAAAQIAKDVLRKAKNYE